MLQLWRERYPDLWKSGYTCKCFSSAPLRDVPCRNVLLHSGKRAVTALLSAKRVFPQRDSSSALLLQSHYFSALLRELSGRNAVVLLCSSKRAIIALSRQRYGHSAQLWQKFLLCSAPLWRKKVFTQASFKRFTGREEPRRVVASARVEIGSSQLNRYRAYIEFLRGRIFLG